MITADDTPETLLKAVRGQADRYVTKPFAPAAIVEVVEDVLPAPPAAALPIEVVSARPEWVELVAPCSLRVADRIQSFMMRLDADLPEDVRESVGQAFRELLCNAIEWGGKLDPDAHGAHLLHSRPPDAALPHRRPGPGIRHRASDALGDQQSGRRPAAARVRARREGPASRRAWASRSRARWSTS